MHLSRIYVKNFRNFQLLDVELGPTSVIVGENNVGKTNLLYAIRLILDPKLSDFSRLLRAEDFWEGLDNPVKNGETIEVAIELQGFKGNSNECAVLQTFCVQSSVEDTARLTYVFRPISPRPVGRPLTIEDYEFIVFGGISEKKRVDSRTRRWIPVELLPALRDAENDLSAWRQSPLRPLIDNLDISEDTLIKVASSIDGATDQLLAENEVQELTERIQTRLSRMVGKVLHIDPTLGFVPAIPERLTRALRLFGDGENRRPVGELGLGVDNVLYLLLLALDLELKEDMSERASTIIAIEEPEAHLHPHLQRLVFRDFLRQKSPVLLTTHSPHIASVAPLKSIVLLRDDPCGNGTKGSSVLQASLSVEEVSDLERYIDATRAEVLFAKGVVLVEGATELFVVPAAAEQMCKPLDESGITVCSVHGVDFVPYAKLLGPGGLNIPFVILTDGDPYTTNDGIEASRGLRRADLLAHSVGHSNASSMRAMWENRQWDDLHRAAREIGVFVGKRTLELDLIESEHGYEIVTSLRELGASERSIEALKELAGRARIQTDTDVETVNKAIRSFGKGRLAQRFANKIDVRKLPDYIARGIDHITDLVAQ